LKDKINKFQKNVPKFEKSSFIPLNDLQNILEDQEKDEIEIEYDFFSKDIRKKNFSLMNFTGAHFLFDR
jgi:hypothetical protein